MPRDRSNPAPQPNRDETLSHFSFDSIDETASRPAMQRWIPGLVLVVIFVLLAGWSWQKWTDPLIDYGLELYIAWQLSEGASLYTDMAHRHGPLPHYANAALFAVWGVSLRTLVIANLAILAAICAMSFRLLRPAFGALAATTACGFFLIVFGFSQYVPNGNFNYVTPYQHAQTHGLALSLAMILFLAGGRPRRNVHRFALAGVCLGGVALGKAETFVPAAVTALAGLCLPFFESDRESRPRGRDLSAFLAGSGITLFAAFLFLFQFRTMSPRSAWIGILGNWAYLGGEVAQDTFYLHGAGLDAPLENLGLLLAAVGVFTVATAIAVWLDRRVSGGSHRDVVCVAAGLVTFAVLARLVPLEAWYAAPRLLPVTTLAIGIGLWVPRVRRKLGTDARANAFGAGLLCLFALGLLGKMILMTRIVHYGFVLAMPAALLLIAAMVGMLPAMLRARWAGGQLIRAIALGAIAAMALGHWVESDRVYRHKTLAFGSGSDEIRILARADQRGTVMVRALEILSKRIGDDETLLVLPEGIGINYWLRRPNPTRFNLFLPPEIQGLGGEEVMLEDIADHPPDWIVLADRDVSEFGVGPFGRDPRNGAVLLGWVVANYERIGRIGEEPFHGRGFGVVIFRRRDAASGLLRQSTTNHGSLRRCRPEAARRSPGNPSRIRPCGSWDPLHS